MTAAVTATVTAARQRCRDGDGADDKRAHGPSSACWCPHCASGAEGGSAAARSETLTAAAGERDARGRHTKMGVVGYGRGVRVLLAPLVRRRCSAQSSGHSHILSVRGKLRVRVGGPIGGESVARWTASQMGSSAHWSARSASAINESRQNGAERRRRRRALPRRVESSVKCVNAISLWSL